MQFGVFLAATDLNEGRPPHELLQETIQLAVEAERLGFDYVWLPEHDLVRFIVNTSALQEAVLIASKTSRIKIGAAVFVTPLYHPLTLAADISEADNLTLGRFEPGFGRGGSQYELGQLQVALPDADSRVRFSEFCDVIKRCWESDEAVEYHGRFFDFSNAFVLPRPYSQPYPRTWMASISAESCATNAAAGANVLFTPFRRPFSHVEEAYRAFAGAGGHQMSPHGRTQFMVSRHTYVANTMEEAKRILPLVDYHEHVIGASRQDGEWVVNGVRGWKQGLKLGLTEEEYLENLVIGDPDTVVSKVKQYHELGIDQYCAYTTLGQDWRLALRSLELFADHVIPAFRNWPELAIAKDSAATGAGEASGEP